MRLFNKSTFPLACLILLMAFVAMPVWSHPVPDLATEDVDDDFVGGHTDEDAHLAHAVAKSIKFSDATANGYVRTDSFVIKIEFDGAGGAPTDFDDTNFRPAVTLREVSGAISAGGWTLEKFRKWSELYCTYSTTKSWFNDSCCHKFNGRRCGYD